MEGPIHILAELGLYENNLTTDEILSIFEN